jgi:hypothetical protein
MSQDPLKKGFSGVRYLTASSEVSFRHIQRDGDYLNGIFGALSRNIRFITLNNFE